MDTDADTDIYFSPDISGYGHRYPEHHSRKQWRSERGGGAFGELLQVESCPGTTAALPCPALTPTEKDDRSLAAFWYKDDHVTPFYMVDARGSASTEKGIHRQLSALGLRASFNVSGIPAMLYLDVESKEDAGVYVCRVDSFKSLTRTSTVELKVLAPTPKLKIYEGEKELSDVAGPYKEGSDLELTCELTGGDSSPMQVLWMIRNNVVDSTFKVLPNGRMKNDYLMRSLERSLWMIPIACVAISREQMNSTSEPLLAAAIQLDLFLRPLSVRITPSHGTCQEGSLLELRCRTWGSRPPADITWWMSGFRLLNTSGYNSDSESSFSFVSLIPSAADHGKIVTCRVENSRLLGSVLTENITLNVTFPPKVSLSLKTYSSSSISEGDTIALLCKVLANPTTGPVQWSFSKESSIGPTTEEYPKTGPHTLILERLEPWHKGSYKCKAANNEGVGESNSLWLAVRHRPICRAGQQVSYGAYYGETLYIRCEVEAEPGSVSFHWSFANTQVHHDNITFHSKALRSIATYTPTKDVHLGSLFCWANNSAGEQHVPCTFTVFRPAKPNPPKNCQTTNRTATSFLVICEAGYDGGAPQQFYFRAKIKGSPEQGITLHAPIPVFYLTSLPSGATFTGSVVAKNKMGQSDPFQFETTTLYSKNKDHISWKVNRSLLISFVLVLIIAVVTMATVASLRRSHPFLL
ncbi:carcinoembryonic antigen-related cell adhesion molecule 5-like [Uloborus diversus]|uniref:carcinoembryonic antigen-related cell adhesion molecule 5-like n=1 Tax=Uloborus diversus TaxID=327109 RepID=UPI002409538D|nr:carcinoembryonic antigen-related cell adhesion molecule 5-like [Uloborus diversus]